MLQGEALAEPKPDTDSVGLCASVCRENALVLGQGEAVMLAVGNTDNDTAALAQLLTEGGGVQDDKGS